MEKVDELRGRSGIVALTAYSYPLGRLLDEVGVDIILVGDSLGMVEHGREDTVSVTLEEMEHHVRSVARGVQRALLIADLPFGTYDAPMEAVQSARRLLAAGAEAVKLEGGMEMVPQVEALRAEGIEVMGHLGMLPQRIREEGKYRIKGRTDLEAGLLLEGATALEAAGVMGIVLELVHPPVAKEITQACAVPTIGIGSGLHCRGQILVTYDLIGLTPWFRPGFVQPKAAVGETIQEAVRAFMADVRAGG
jgi:3-methyl-2-oxobutanoate hydroxymethyltransferase